jgi:hypothetical protein
VSWPVSVFLKIGLGIPTVAHPEPLLDKQRITEPSLFSSLNPARDIWGKSCPRHRNALLPLWEARALPIGDRCGPAVLIVELDS